MKRFSIFSLLLILGLVMFTPQVASAQNQVQASDYTKYVFTSANAVTAGAASFTVNGNGFTSTNRGVTFTPFATTTVIAISASGGTAESVTPSAVTCPYGLNNSCVVTATFSYAHDKGFEIRTGDLGVDEARRASNVGDLVYVHKAVSVTLTAAATFTSSGMIPAGVFLDAITIRVTTAITKAGAATTLWTFGDGTTADLWGTALALAAGTTTNYSNYKTNYGSIGIVKAALTPTGTATTDNFAGGVVVINATYHIICY